MAEHHAVEALVIVELADQLEAEAVAVEAEDGGRSSVARATRRWACMVSPGWVFDQ